jgi:Na+-driven multidrug efflux pump
VTQCELANGLGFSGLVRGVGWQKWGVYANFGAHYAVGLPTAIILVLVFHFDCRVCEEHHITFL